MAIMIANAFTVRSFLWRRFKSSAQASGIMTIKAIKGFIDYHL
ncbi:MAG: hypothetical protein ACXVHS_04445 [Methanobacterium sp.]